MPTKKTNESKKTTQPIMCNSTHTMKCHSGNAGYCLGFIGAAVYYISTATSFWMGVLGVLKALVWPAFLVYGLLKYLGL